MERLQRFPSKLLVASSLLMLLGLTGCLRVLAPEAEPLDPTRTPIPTFTATEVAPAVDVVATEAVVAATTQAVVAVVTEVAEPTDAPAEPTATPTPEAAVAVTTQGMNVRGGPGTTYPILGGAQANQQYVIKGKDPTGAWWQVDYNGRDGWLFAQLVTANNSGGVPVAQNIPAPPPPTNTPIPAPVQPAPEQPAPAQPTQPPPPAESQTQFPFILLEGVETCRANPGITYFDGFVRRRDNSLYNGVCVHIAFFGPRNTKCSGCDGVGDGNWSFSPFGGQPAPSGTTVEIFVVQCPAGGMAMGGQTEQSGFGDLTPRSPKWIKTINESMECHGITFVGD